jgi:hypothetical protein
MPYHIDWYIDQQVLFARLWGALDAQDYAAFFRDCYAAYDQSDRPMIHLVVDASQLTGEPKLMEIKQALPGTTHPQSGWAMAILKNGDNVLMRFMMNAFSSAANQRLRQVRSVDEGLGFLRRIDPSITWGQARPDVLQPMVVEASL